MFCTEQASSKEDIWPQWLTKYFPSSSASYMEAKRGGKKLGSWQTKTSRLLTAKSVCKSCNNGWMSALENKMKPIAVSILKGQLEELNTLSQETMAVWSTKTAMVLEALFPKRDFFYSVNERKDMRKLSSIPERTSVWIAKCVDQSSIYSASKDLCTVPGSNDIKAYVTTMAFGTLAFQIVSLRTPANFPKEKQITYETREGPWDKTLIQVWPTKPYKQQWPPNNGLNGERGLETFTERLSPIKKLKISLP